LHNNEIGKAVARLIIQNKRIHQAIVACKPETAAAIKKIDHHIKICNMERRDNSGQYVIETLAFNSDFIQLKECADPFLSILIPQLKQNGVRINYFGTNSTEKLKQLFTAGVDFPLVDNVSGLMKIVKELGIKSVRPIFGEKYD
jgi:glycerophosphoryl diester phosphodiesterase